MHFRLLAWINGYKVENKLNLVARAPIKVTNVNLLLTQNHIQNNSSLTKGLICEGSLVLIEIDSGASVSVTGYDTYTRYFSQLLFLNCACVLRSATTIFYQWQVKY